MGVEVVDTVYGQLRALGLCDVRAVETSSAHVKLGYGCSTEVCSFRGGKHCTVALLSK